MMMKRIAASLLLLLALPCTAFALSGSAIPTAVSTYWGSSAPGGNITCPIPIPSQISTSPGRASWTDGFPPLTFLLQGAGGVPPSGQDFNGVLCQLSQWTRWYNAGAPIPYSATFQSAIGGYPSNAIVPSAVYSGVIWQSGVDNNLSDPDTGGVNWNLFALPSAVYSGGGSANAQSITIPGVFALSELQGRVFQYTPSASNTGATTLAVSGLTENVLKEAISGATPGLQSLAGGELQAGKVAALFWDGTEFVLLNPFPVPTALVTGQVYFEYDGTTSVLLKPQGGANFVINGAEYQIPSGGVSASNSGLSANTLYDVYLYNNSGTLTLSFQSTSSGNHCTSATAGNVGIEILCGNNAYSYVGKVETDASSQFQEQGVGTLSWYNRKTITFWGQDTYQTYTTTSTTPVELSTSERANFITFGDSSVVSELAGQVWTSAANTSAQLWVGLDGTNEVGFQTTVTATVGTAVTVPGFLPPSEGAHYLTPMGNATTGGTASFGDMQFYFSEQG
ncbi:MAG: hypothetical protein ACRELF_04595 [Gemmataceae bacterium]